MRYLINPIIIFILLVCLIKNAFSIDLNDVYQKQLQIENKTIEMYADLVARISYSGDLAKARADINSLNCSRYLESMKDFGNTTINDANQSKSEIFYELRFRRCMALESLFRWLPFNVRTSYFEKYSEQLAGYGASPYEDVGFDIFQHSDYVAIIKKNIDNKLYQKYVCELTNKDNQSQTCLK